MSEGRDPAAVPPETETVSYIVAVNHGLRWALQTYPECIVFGEDIAKPGGPFGATKGLYREFGEQRVFDTPISESAMIGAALGAAMRGLRPVVEIMYMDFSLVAMDQIVNQIANTHYVSVGAWRAPLVIRTQQGYSPGACAQHSQSLESLFAHIPGLRLCVPSTPADAYAMTRDAVASDDPVLVIESRMLYQMKGAVDLGASPGSDRGARVLRQGADVTIVSWSRMVHEALSAAEGAAERGIDTEVIDLRWLNPLDFGTVAASVAKTGRVVIAQEANLTAGFGAEIAARVADECFFDLRAPVLRVGTPDLPVPASPTLQEAVIPAAPSILNALLTTQSSAGQMSGMQRTASPQR